jgi:uncharacterized membrane protein YvbJ
MVTCPKCGTKNQDDAKFCVNCGADLLSTGGERRHGGGDCFGQQNRRPGDECFGLPNGGAIVGLVIGMLIIIYGLSNFFGWRIDFGPMAMIMVGVLIVAGAIYGMSRRR